MKEKLTWIMLIVFWTTVTLAICFVPVLVVFETIKGGGKWVQ